MPIVLASEVSSSRALTKTGDGARPLTPQRSVQSVLQAHSIPDGAVPLQELPSDAEVVEHRLRFLHMLGVEDLGAAVQRQHCHSAACTAAGADLSAWGALLAGLGHA